MDDYLNIKRQLLEHCIQFVQQKKESITKSIESNKNDLFSETKSSAGDKHETGRAMIQLEMEKSGQQLVVVSEMKKVLERIQFEKQSNYVKLGSIIKTTKGTYFLAISVGQIKIEENLFYVISSQSPIGKQLLGSKVGSIVNFNGAEIIEVL